MHTIQINDVYVDENGLIYANDRFAGGLYIDSLHRFGAAATEMTSGKPVVHHAARGARQL